MILQDNIIKYINTKRTELLNNLPEYVLEIRQNAIRSFSHNGFPKSNDEKWRKTKLKDFFNQNFHPDIGLIVNREKYLNDYCLVPELETNNISLVNGLFIGEYELKTFSNGVILGSLKAALHQYPDLLKDYFGRLTRKHSNPLVDLNTSVFSDGMFLYVPKVFLLIYKSLKS